MVMRRTLGEAQHDFVNCTPQTCFTVPLWPPVAPKSHSLQFTLQHELQALAYQTLICQVWVDASLKGGEC